MKKKITSVLCAAVLCTLCIGHASALEYSFAGADEDLFGRATSVDAIHELEDGNVDRSKDVALVAPGFGTPTSYLPGSGEHLTPNLVPGALSGGLVNAVPGYNYDEFPTVSTEPPSGSDVSWTISGNTWNGESWNTAVTPDLYYSDGSLGTLVIPSIGLDVKVYEGTGDTSMKNGVGHFEDTSIWTGNVVLAGHNRGVNTYFGKIDTLAPGAEITFTTKMGARTYRVTSVEKISNTDASVLNSSSSNRITLLTCVRDQPNYRWCVRAAAV